MSTYKLTYFNGRGRGECSRMLLAAAGKKFEDNRIEFADWATLKPTTTHGSLPILEVNANGKQISLSTSIARFLARDFALYGKGNAEATLIDMIFDTTVDMLDAHVRLVFSQSDKKEEEMAEFQKEKLPVFLGILEKLVGELGKGGFAVGSSLSLADIALYVYIEGVKAQDSLEKFPKLAENRKKVAALPKIKEYLEKRPKTDF